MVLEACAAVGVAAAGIQFVDFAIKVASKSKEYQSNASHYPQKHIELEGIAENFARLTHDLTSSLEEVAGKPSSAQEGILTKVAYDCHSVAREFQQALDNLKVQGTPRKWKSFRKALESCWNEKKLEQMLQKLRLAREDLIVHLLAVISTDRKSGVGELLQHSTESENRLHAAILGSQVQAVSQIKDFVEQANESHADTTSHLIHLLKEKYEDLLTEITCRLPEVETATDEREIEGMILHSLNSPQLTERYAAIPKPHAATFRWILEDDLLVSKPWPSLSQWLSSISTTVGTEKIYSITGKAGSGKSTLMKYIYDNPRTKTLLSEWAQSQDLLLANCFFWNPGPEIQRSRGGLLRSLLYQLLSRNPNHIKNAVPWRWQCYRSGTKDLEPWTDFELKDAFAGFLKSCESTSKVCLFIDGLDEYGESNIARSELISFLKETSKLPHVKICLSSRPLLLYEDALPYTAHLELHNLTRDCIKGYVQDNFLDSEYLSDLQRTDSEGCSQLASEIVSQASGVFLWVSLAIRDMLFCLQNGDRISDLRRKLRSMPSDLYEFLRKIIGSLETFYLRQAYIFFHATIASHEGLEPLTYFYLQEGLSDKIIRLGRRERISEQEIDARERLAVRQIKSRCGGLLEVRKSVSSIKITFLHRTVKELLEDKILHEMQEQISKTNDLHVEVQPLESICKALLAQMKETTCCGDEFMLLTLLLEDFMHYVRRYEDATDTSLPFLVDEAAEHVGKVLKVVSNHTSNTPLATMQQTPGVQSWKFYRGMSDRYSVISFIGIMHGADAEVSFLYMALRYGLLQYLITKFSGTRNLLQRVAARKPLRRFFAEVIDTAIHPLMDLDPPGCLPELLKLILDAGANPNETHCTNDGYTAWAHYLLLLVRHAAWHLRKHIDDRAVRVFIEHGAHQTVTVLLRHLPGDHVGPGSELVETSVFFLFYHAFDPEVALALQQLMLERDKPRCDDRRQLSKSSTRESTQKQQRSRNGKEAAQGGVKPFFRDVKIGGLVKLA